jgi:hypothetical protein
MIAFITYICKPSNEQRILEWVAPEDWTRATIGQHFEQQFPGAEIVRIDLQS